MFSFSLQVSEVLFILLKIKYIVTVFTLKLINSVSSSKIIKLGYPAGWECGIPKEK